MASWFRKRKGDERSPEEAMLDRWARSCPVCGAALGARAAWSSQTRFFEHPPSLKLEIGGPNAEENYPWRVSVMHVNFRPVESSDPPFFANEVEDVYLLCGGGHIFPLATPVLSNYGGRFSDDQRVDDWNMVAAVGSPASGKTYLLLRMMSQNLVDRRLDFTDRNRIQLRRLSPLESIPLKMRADGYDETRNMSTAIMPTNMDLLAKPEGIFNYLLPDALVAIKDLIGKTVRGGKQRAETWGTHLRQPLVMRTDTNNVRTWTGIADLPGELFSGNAANRRETVKLRSYDALIWVIDPAVAANTLDWLDANALSLSTANAPADTDQLRNMVLDGSLRPGATAQQGSRVIRHNRDAIQRNISQELTLLDGEYTDLRSPLELLITITKCDLIRAALQVRDLYDLGEPGEVIAGSTAYLLWAAKRLADGDIGADRASATLLQQVGTELQAEQFAQGLLGYYSNPAHFWNLVHEGMTDQIDIAARGSEQAWRVPVPDVNKHLTASLMPGAQRMILIRDLVMSTIGCGIGFGLVGYDAMFKLLLAKSQNVRFFLCSPLATVPVEQVEQKDDMDQKQYFLTPLDKDASFPNADDRSAGLTQLLLGTLTKARPKASQL